jgi:type I restriction enzyme R subunit
MVMVHKFQERKRALPMRWRGSAGHLSVRHAHGKTFGVVNTSQRILLMIDEAHRTQSSDLGDNLFEAFPNATRIAFTGTPLDHRATRRAKHPQALWRVHRHLPL